MPKSELWKARLRIGALGRPYLDQAKERNRESSVTMGSWTAGSAHRRQRARRGQSALAVFISGALDGCFAKHAEERADGKLGHDAGLLKTPALCRKVSVALGSWNHSRFTQSTNSKFFFLPRSSFFSLPITKRSNDSAPSRLTNWTSPFGRPFLRPAVLAKIIIIMGSVSPLAGHLRGKITLSC